MLCMCVHLYVIKGRRLKNGYALWAVLKIQYIFHVNRKRYKGGKEEEIEGLEEQLLMNHINACSLFIL